MTNDAPDIGAGQRSIRKRPPWLVVRSRVFGMQVIIRPEERSHSERRDFSSSRSSPQPRGYRKLESAGDFGTRAS